MSREAVLLIRQTEESAAEIRLCAVKEARAMTEEARQAALALYKQAEVDTRAEIKDMLSKTKEDAALLIKKARAEAGAEAKAMTVASEPKKDEAVRLIMRKLVEKCQ